MYAILKVRPLSKYSEFGQHLTERHFFSMMGIAFVLHLFGFLVYQFVPQEQVVELPVRTISIKLGGGGAVSVQGAQQLNTDAVLNNPTAPIQQVMGVPENITQEMPAMRALDNVLDMPAAPLPDAKPVKQPPAMRSSTITQSTAQKAEQLPSKFIRQQEASNMVAAGAVQGTEEGAGTGAGIGSGSGSEAEVLRRYEQLLSLWIERHKIYPESAKAAGLQGDAVIRIRIDRSGNVVYYRLDKPTASDDINRAIDQMVRAASPVPAVPSTYPAGNLFEFLIPVSFRIR